MLKQGLSPTSIARELRLKESYVHERAKLVRLDRTGQSVDVTVSQFARHDEHCAAVMEFGGYPVIDHASRRIVGPTGGAWPGILRQA